MTLLRLALANLRATPLSSAVNILLLALGAASIAVLLLASTQLSSTLTKNAAGIDLVIGSKGSPLQLVLAGVYHADIPPGNIPVGEVQRWQDHPLVEAAIPLSIGDSYRGFRIVGTVPEFGALYDGKLSAGKYWDGPFEALIGSHVASSEGLTIGDAFAGVHGLADDGDQHEEATYRVVGQFSRSDSVLDGLILTSLDSVWLMHGAHHEDDHDEEGHHEDDHDEEGHREDHHAAKGELESESSDQEEPLGEEVTLLLIKLSSPLGVMSLPREINAEVGLQAASPAFEIARLLQIVGIGINWLNAFAIILVVSAALSIFAALYASLRARRFDLAILRCLGGTRWELFYLLLVEGLLLTVFGIILGLLIAHGGIELVGQWLGDGQGIALSGWMFAEEELLLVAGLLFVGSVTALLPAWQAYGTDVSRTLSKY